ncbi:hypothetical protein C464_11720 [Halorubrum coriense DSM 10284]|uniref:Uncharacterized protein n=1 Tax=Halorubrum coriense DSM 10284 TaxID=1227466 RepID=M0EE60_9EURY|nr:hypothetical protein [Halorubrum coriense]ELZ46005.1 hypothetical protein C464_11720 [Halorubrum coriense DSM 10284]
MAFRDAFARQPQAKAYALAAVSAALLFLETVVRSRQYSIREGQPVPARTALDLLVDVAGTYLVVPGLLFVAYYAIDGIGPRIPLTARSLGALLAAVVAGSLAGQYVGGAPHSLRFLLGSNAFAARPLTARLWLDVFGPIGRDFLAAVGLLVVTRAVRHARGDREDPVE